jgi:NADH-quinone oxidoreductase subunit M
MLDGQNYLSGALLSSSTDSTLFGQPIRFIAFLALFIGFAIKLPVVPLHTWLPDAHVEAPTAISVILAGLLLKVGGYSIFRFAYGIFPDGAEAYTVFIGILGVLSILYGAFNALAQRDLKRLIAYSSVSHMGYVLLGFAALTSTGVNGALFHMFSHGLISGALFLIAGVVYERTDSRLIENYSGLASKMPSYTFVVVLMFFASLGLPGLSGFVGEIMVLMGAFEAGRTGTIPYLLAVLAVLGIIITAAYYLWTIQRMFFGKYWVREESWSEKMSDLTYREWLMFIPLMVLVVLLGIYPRLILDIFNTSTNQWLEMITQGAIKMTGY